MAIAAEAKKKLEDLERGVEYQLGRYVATPKTKLMDDSLKSKLIWTGVGTVGGLAAGLLMPKLLKSPLKKLDLITGAISGGVGGYYTPALSNIIISEKQKLMPKKEAKEQYAAISDIKKNVKHNVDNYPDMFKKSGLTSMLKTPVKAIGSSISGGVRAIGGGVAEPLWSSKKRKFGRKVWGLTVKGGIGAGAIAGGRRIARHTKKSQSNYVTMLRNNILSGNIKQNELSPADMMAVQNIGMR